jgi:GntR family transcriptional regulator / MocR family aminotransferase
VTKRANPKGALRLQVYQQLRQAIESGTLAPGVRLPASRDHALLLGVSRNTVLWAVERLQAEGYVMARVGDGSYVRALGAAHPSPAGGSPLASTERLLSQRGQHIASTALQWNPPLQSAVPFRIGAPEVDVFPFATWDRLSRQVSLEQRRAAAQYLNPAGSDALRDAVAQWLWASRGVRCEAAQVLVCSGSQQAIDLIGRVLLDVGDAVLVEDPGYPGIRANLLSQGAQVCPVPVDAQGLCIAQGYALWPQARMAVVTPTHQFPTGVAMGLQRRMELLDWAQATGAWLVEDDYDGEFQYGPHRLPALCGLAGADKVLYVGTFSKTLHPGLRLGFIVAPHRLVEPLAMAKALADRHAPGDTQAVLARFIQEGHLLRHLRRMRALYAQRQAVLIEAIAQHTHGRVQLAPSQQGMQLLYELPAGCDDRTVSGQAQAAGVVLAPLSRYTIESQRRGWVLGYSGYDAAALQRAAQVVGPLMERFVKGL